MRPSTQRTDEIRPKRVELELPENFQQDWDIITRTNGHTRAHSWAGFTTTDDPESVSSNNSETFSVASAPTVLDSPPTPEARATDKPQHESSKLWPPVDKVLIAAVRTALHWIPEDRTVPIFDFSLSNTAAEKNFAILKSAGFDLQSIIMGDDLSPLRPGSEFRPVGILAPIFEGHPFWPRVRETLSNGADFFLEPIDEADRLKVLDEALEYGNHKSASKHSEALMGMLTKEVAKGWHLPLPIDRLYEIPNLIIGPMGLVEQFSIDEDGNIIPKLRMTHDQSFTYNLEDVKSVNQRVVPEHCRDTLNVHDNPHFNRQARLQVGLPTYASNRVGGAPERHHHHWYLGRPDRNGVAPRNLRRIAFPVPVRGTVRVHCRFSQRAVPMQALGPQHHSALT